MTTKSQEAFEKAFPHRDLTQDLDGVYVTLPTRVHYKDFCLGYELGRKAALEDALAIVKKENKVGNMEFEIKELMK
jgi:hypothetical protein